MILGICSISTEDVDQKLKSFAGGVVSILTEVCF